MRKGTYGTDSLYELNNSYWFGLKNVIYWHYEYR